MTKNKREQILKYVNKKLKKTKSDNVYINIEDKLTAIDIKYFDNYGLKVFKDGYTLIFLKKLDYYTAQQNLSTLKPLTKI